MLPARIEGAGDFTSQLDLLQRYFLLRNYRLQFVAFAHDLCGSSQFLERFEGAVLL
jgi:hypothetical protein